MEHCNKIIRPIDEPEVWTTNMRTYNSSGLAVSRLASKLKRAFTLIELLVVIAIIALLTALLFPVFATARENARQSATMTHLQAIQSGLALYKLDNHQYPSVLFGYAAPNGNSYWPMSNAAQIATYTTTQGGSGLYPTYVNDFHNFESQDTTIDDQPTATVALESLELQQNTGTAPATPTSLNTVARNFYVMDNFDVSPQTAALGTNNQFAAGTATSTLRYVLRYQRDWTNVQSLQDSTGAPTTFAAPPYYTNYLHQLRWQNPPADTYVTSSTYHVPNANKVMVLFESGTVVKMDRSQLLGGNNYDDSKSCWNTVGGTNNTSCAPDSNGDNPGLFWKVSNSQ